MRIGIYDPYLDDLGGGEKYMMSIAQALSDAHTVDIFWNNKEDIATLLQRFHLDLSKVTCVKNIFSQSLFSRFIASGTYDRLIVLSDGSIPLVNSKLFLHIQQPLQSTQLQSFWGKIKLARVSKVFYNSFFTKSFVEKLLPIQSAVIYPPVTLRPKKVVKQNIILHVGRFRVKNVSIGDYKKQHIMVQVFTEMVDKGLQNWKFILAVSIKKNDEEAFKKLQDMAKGYPVEFLVNKSNDDLWTIYSKAKIYWHASGYGENLKQHPEFAEHFGISTVEAMGAGAVPVVINAGGQREIVTEGKNGLLWNTLDELKEKTLFLIKNETMRKKLAQEAEKRAQDFSYEKFSEAIHALIQ